MIGTKEISLSKALKYYDDPMKCQRKLDLTEKEYKSLLNKMIKRVQGNEKPKEKAHLKPTALKPSTSSTARSSTLPVHNPGSNATPREPVRFQPPIIQNDIMLPMPQPSYEASSNVNPVDGRTPIQAPLWFDMLAGDTKPSVEHSKINAESIGHRQLSSQILPPQLNLKLKPESPRFQPSQSQAQHPVQPSQSQSQYQSQAHFQHPAQSSLNSQFQSSMETDFNQPVQGAQPQFNPQQFRQQTAQSRSSNNLSTSRVFDIGRTDFPAVISRVPHNTRIKTPKNDFS
jgi:hypothetical protein